MAKAALRSWSRRAPRFASFDRRASSRGSPAARATTGNAPKPGARAERLLSGQRVDADLRLRRDRQHGIHQQVLRTIAARFR